MTRSNFQLIRKHRRQIPQCLQRTFVICALFWLILSLWQAPVVSSGQLNTQELRGVWMTNLGAALMYYTTRMDEAVAHIAEHRLNTIYLAVWNRGYTLHPSTIAFQAGGKMRDPLTLLLLLPFQDSLLGLVHQTRRQHLRLIPWFEYGQELRS
ncbi:family 10 glycosylhydrolase [Gloeocapsopsis dulcis]|uniref:family 10 glycosylhydrolase n=1 Tax=Gloeocapsopsis dulcis TaxID=2859516 RepID=UPI001F46B21E|nr:family 10 glycosylhydrolase [Gloeocapsopsis dulcis]WNN92326.1 family 10 glycosylhydrolase [Gloeocapsopsis dulcis]